MIEIDRNSWHYKLTGDRYFRNDLCAYTRAVLWGLVKRLALGAAVLAVLLGVMDVALALWFRVEPELPGKMLLIVLGAIALIAVVCFTMAGVSILAQKTGESMVAEAYRGWKEKYCPTVKVV